MLYSSDPRNLTRVSLSSSPSSSSPAPFMPKTMEEVWKDINLSSLPNPRLNPNFILQDFLSKDPPTNNRDDSTHCGSPIPSPPATVLSLNSGPGFDFLENSRLQSNTVWNLSVFNCPLEALASNGSLGSFGRKRIQESENNSGDRRHKRMIKNRESAARSRARKQAYTNELEFEVQHLREENARLKRQQEQICVAAAAMQLSKRHTLQRTSTAPF